MNRARMPQLEAGKASLLRGESFSSKHLARTHLSATPTPNNDFWHGAGFAQETWAMTVVKRGVVC
jgi:hypothetical protein